MLDLNFALADFVHLHSARVIKDGSVQHDFRQSPHLLEINLQIGLEVSPAPLILIDGGFEFELKAFALADESMDKVVHAEGEVGRGRVVNNVETEIA